MKYTLYATKENGTGHVSEIGQFGSIEDIEIRIGMFAPDVVITVEENYDVDEDEE